MTKHSFITFYLSSKDLTTGISGQTMAIPTIRIPDIKNQLFTPILSANIPERIKPTGIAKDIMLPVRESPQHINCYNGI
jgi:hypothetical protein